MPFPVADFSAAWLPIYLEPGDTLALPITLPSPYAGGTWTAALYRSETSQTALATLSVAGTVTKTVGLSSDAVAALMPRGGSRFVGFWRMRRDDGAGDVRTWFKGFFVVDGELTVPANGTTAVTVTVSTPVVQVTSTAVDTSGGVSQAALDAAVLAEANARASADTALSTSISTEVTNRQTAVSGEAATRAAADTAISNALAALGDPVTIGHGGTGATTAPLARAALGLGNVDNTSDLAKPVSTAQATAISAAVNGLINGAPGALDTLNELATAMGNDAAFSTTVTNALAGKLALATITAANQLVTGTGAATAGVLDVPASRLVGRGAAGGLTVLDAAAAKTLLAIVAGDVSGLGALATKSAVASADITDNTIVNADIAPGAGIAISKLAAIAQSDVTGLVAALAALQPLDADLTAIAALAPSDGTVITRAGGVWTAAAPSGGSGAAVVVRRAIVTAGDITLPNTSGAWALLSGIPELTIPAVAGSELEVLVHAMRSYTGSGYLDVVVVTGATPTIQRYLSTGTSTPAIEGDPGWYAQASFMPQSSGRSFTVASGDLDAGNVRLRIAVKAAGSGVLYASGNYPYQWSAKCFPQ